MKKLVVLFSWLLVCGAASAQQPAQGFPPYGIISRGEFDSVNLENLNVQFSIPIVTLPGRGMGTNLAISYNSNFYYRAGYPNTWWVSPGWQESLTPPFTTTPQFLFGWNFGIDTPFTSNAAEIVTCDMDGHSTTHYFNYASTDIDGTTHAFDAEMYDDATLCNFGPVGSTQGLATDGSGWRIVVPTSYQSPTVYTPAGIRSPSPTGTITDTNGNYLLVSMVSSTVMKYIDTLGRTVATIVRYSDHFEYQVTDVAGATQKYTLNFQWFNVRTNFSCASTGEYTPRDPVQLPVSLVLPNGRSYAFTYEDTPGWPGWTTTRLKRVTLPTGGYYEYLYPSTGTGGMYCTTSYADPPTLVNLTRNINDGISTQSWNYSRVPVDNPCLSSCSHAVWKTKVTPPQLPYDTAPNESTHTFTALQYPNSQQIDERYYRGLEASNQLLKLLTTIKSADHRAVSVTVTLENNQQSKTETDWNADNQLLEKREYDWGIGAPGPLLRRTTYTYLSDAPHTNQGIRDRLTQKIIKDGSGSIKFRTDIAYDESGKINTSCPTGIPGHDDVNYGCTYTARGNRTSVTVYTDPVTPSGGITQGYTYDWFGNVLSTQVNSVVQNQLNFSSATQYGFPDSSVNGPSGGPQLTTRATYNPYTSQVVTTTDANGQMTTFTYSDPGHMNRPTDSQRPDGQHVATTYDDTALTVTQTSPVQSGTSVKQVTYFDGLGGRVKQQVTDAGGTSYSIAETQYDGIGRPYRTSNPHNSSAQYWNEIDFDAVGRPTAIKVLTSTYSVTTGNTTTFSYSGPQVTVTDPAGKQKKSQSDGLGRLVTLYEPDVSNGNQLTQQTSYTYNALDELTQVAQGAQTRTYAYDGLGRLLTMKVPETNQAQTSYAYNNYGLVTQRTDARNVQTFYQYDGLNHLVGVHYDLSHAAPGVAAMPDVCTSAAGQPANVCFAYGTSSAANNNGRLVSVTDPSGSETYNSYDVLGRLTSMTKTVGGVSYPLSYQYNYAGEPTQVTYPSGRVVEEAYDAIGRLCRVGGSNGSACTASSPFASGFGYNPAFQVTGFSYGNGVGASFGYSNDRLQMTSLSYTKGANTLFSVNYWYQQDQTNCANGTTGNNGQIQCIMDTVDSGRTVNYTYDALYRLKTAQTNGSTSYPRWGLAWTYDRYGNRTAQSIYSGCAPPVTCPTNSVGIDTNTNRILDDCYDQNGNLLAESLSPCPSPPYTYDGENRVVNYSTSASYSYDGNGLRVKKVSGSTTTIYIFSNSRVMAEYDNAAAVGSPSREYIYSGSELLAKIEAGATKYYHLDHLSNRLVTDSTGNPLAQLGTFPFGESWYNAANDKLLFTSYERDSESLNDYARARYYMSRLGRFLSVDPLAGNISNPQSLNRYAYVSNNPTNFTDPLGLCEDNCKGVHFGSLNTGMRGGHCLLDNIDVECTEAFALVQAGAAAKCPYIDCFDLGIDQSGWFRNVQAVEDYYSILCHGPSTSDYICELLPRGRQYIQFLNPNDIYFSSEEARTNWLFSQTYKNIIGDIKESLRIGAFMVASIGANALVKIGATLLDAAAAAEVETTVTSIYSAKVLVRSAEESGPYHNFPMTFDKLIIGRGEIGKLTGDYVQYELPGTINGARGVYEIGGNWVGDTFVIIHRFFRVP